MKEEKSLSFLYPHLLKEWDYEKNNEISIFPERISPGTHKKAFWVCSKNPEHKWNAIIKNRTLHSSGCPFCRGLKVNHTNCLSLTHLELLTEWDYKKNIIQPGEVTAGSHKKAFWVCSKNPEHKWSAIISKRTLLRRGCPFCTGKQINHTNCLSTTHPHLLEEWDYEKNKIKPEEITYGSSKKIFWFCSKNKEHKWRATVGSRTGSYRSGCPYCTGKQINHTNCLSTTHPHLLEEWDYEKNKIKPEEVSFGSEKRVFWVCSKNPEHKWNAIIGERTRGRGCPFCATLISKGHQEVVDFISTIYKGTILVNDRTTIKNPQTKYFLEIDILLPEIQLAIEYNGNFYHSNYFKKNPHIREQIKKNECEKQGLIFLPIWEEDWKQRNYIVKTKIKSFLFTKSVETFCFRDIVNVNDKKEQRSTQ